MFSIQYNCLAKSDFLLAIQLHAKTVVPKVKDAQKDFKGGVKDDKLSSACFMSFFFVTSKTLPFLENASTKERIEFFRRR